jgi:hypothetical protein
MGLLQVQGEEQEIRRIGGGRNVELVLHKRKYGLRERGRINLTEVRASSALEMSLTKREKER